MVVIQCLCVCELNIVLADFSFDVNLQSVIMGYIKLYCHVLLSGVFVLC